ncbi:MAG: peptide chain release factor 3 [Chloroflexi bacterium]|nr:peptide chain release factor 3 [Chloroflexota bacterium]MCC6893919.1 peptide chain release factor 3 [Anaerolineae bacterium]
MLQTTHTSPVQLRHEVERRRTFAIISHPDAGKTTLTEKLLLYAGAVNQAGSVRASKNQRSATSDWMAMEQQRGISITSTVLQFEYENCIFNLLDTPGHRDFSEDTYRTLMAADSAIMVLDSAKGIEPQTKKLFEVCRQRNLPILTFINKLDHEGRDPFELLDEIERVLNLQVAPMNWPIGTGSSFQGVYDLKHDQVLLFERTVRGKSRAPVKVTDLYDNVLETTIGTRPYQQLKDDAELLAGAGAPFDRDNFLGGTLTPVFFGSALNNFGVEPFLEALIRLAPPPRPRESSEGLVEPTDNTFSGIIFKIQANMDPQHRDSLAFLRVCSGRFEKDMNVTHPRSGRKVRMTRPHRLFARDRETVDEAFPGDVIGLSNPGIFRIGDTLCEGDTFQFAPIPPFQPEVFATLRNMSTEKYKQFNKGVAQLREEGVVQVLYAVDSSRREPILCAVGELQFEVVVSRMQAEYNVETRIEQLPYTVAAWIEGDDDLIRSVRWPMESLKTLDFDQKWVVLFNTPWQLNYTIKDQPKLRFVDVAGHPLKKAE